MLLEAVHHLAEGLFVRSSDVQNHEARLSDVLLIDVLHVSGDGPWPLDGSFDRLKLPVWVQSGGSDRW